jgi:hypothetical protein
MGSNHANILSRVSQWQSRNVVFLTFTISKWQIPFFNLYLDLFRLRWFGSARCNSWVELGKWTFVVQIQYFSDSCKKNSPTLVQNKRRLDQRKHRFKFQSQINNGSPDIWSRKRRFKFALPKRNNEDQFKFAFTLCKTINSVWSTHWTVLFLCQLKNNSISSN